MFILLTVIINSDLITPSLISIHPIFKNLHENKDENDKEDDKKNNDQIGNFRLYN